MRMSGLFTFAAQVSYTALSGVILCFLLPLSAIYTGLTGRYREGVRERLGIFPAGTFSRPEGATRVWIHAASLGEVNVAFLLMEAVKKLIPGSDFVLSTMTPHGRDLAAGRGMADTSVIYAPVDFAGCVVPALKSIDPDVLVFVETEIWPAWIFAASRRGIPVVLANGRISPRSYPSYMKFRPFFRNVLSRIDKFSMIGAPDAERIINMGAPPAGVTINGNAKYDGLSDRAEEDLEMEARRFLDLPRGSRVLVCGSTREGEEEIILDAYSEILSGFPETVLVIAPRHINRCREIFSAASSRGFSCRLRTEMDGSGRGGAQVLILDTFGELFAAYSTASVVFCGASLVPLGGQNPLEPACWGKAVLYGPSMEDFQDATVLLEEAGAGKEVSGPGDLAREVMRLLGNPEELERAGDAGRKTVVSCGNAAGRHAELIVGLMKDKKTGLPRF